jgi:very-short-patch-repair endonuclease
MGSITDLVRKLRSQQTPEEKQLWNLLRNRQFKGKKFKRQQPIIYRVVQTKKHFFIPDFYCHEGKLVIELDGKIHDFQKDYDQERDLIIKELGLKVLRIKNEELKNPETVMNKILDALPHP